VKFEGQGHSSQSHDEKFEYGWETSYDTVAEKQTKLETVKISNS